MIKKKFKFAKQTKYYEKVAKKLKMKNSEFIKCEN